MRYIGNVLPPTLIILMNYRDIQPKRDNNVPSLKYCDIRSSSGNTFIPCICMEKDDISQENFLCSSEIRSEKSGYIL